MLVLVRLMYHVCLLNILLENENVDLSTDNKQNTTYITGLENL